MFGAIRKACGRLLDARRARSVPGGAEGPGGTARTGGKRTHNLFEAAAVYVSARAEDDQDRIDEAADWVSPEALSFGVNELACRAVIALARERDESPQTVARELLGLPAA
ncbi:hypothetical protein PYK79_01235 [Streptomyces sp. ID05-04B]|uniref:hypothetical protein n=1 Tax=unclassified Streptomyces TaxID=2593676 RepID=UPI000D1BF96B|nr:MULTISPECIES: hypothetical protein [unclassified Streptomyces]AVV46190.1 hypothetical protein C6376_37440 [Streptomyces sp. P3]MDX5562666.1 hypothetical protein [Streptomyces sp. ID05-04B]